MTQKRTKVYLNRLFNDFKYKLNQLDLNQNEAAELLGVTRSHLNKVLNNRTDASLNLIEQIEDFTYRGRKNMTEDLDNIIIDTSNVPKEMSEFANYYCDEIYNAMRNLQEEQSFKIYMLFFFNFHLDPSSEDIFDSISVEDIQKKLNCTADEVTTALDELVDKGFLITENDDEGYVTSVTFIEKPEK